MASPFSDLRGLLDGNRAPIPFRVPPFYSQILRTFRRYNRSDDEPRSFGDASSQSLSGNLRIVGDNGKPFFSKAMAQAGITTVAHLHHNRRLIAIDTVKIRYGFRGPFLYIFRDKIHKALPVRWLSLPDGNRRPPLSITMTFPVKSEIPLASKMMHRSIMGVRQEIPIAFARWQSFHGPFSWRAVWASISAARLHTPFDRDIAFKFVHRVLQTPERRHRFGISESPSCTLCRCRVADLRMSDGQIIVSASSTYLICPPTLSYSQFPDVVVSPVLTSAIIIFPCILRRLDIRRNLQEAARNA